METKRTLADLAPGRRGTVGKLLAEGSMRRRFLDIGLIEGTEVECVGCSPAKDPRAFVIRGAVIAIRKKDCENIILTEPEIRQKTIALAGNPNVGKSTVFNALTGMHQHTGNWAGKTVANAEGICRGKEDVYRLIDIPGTYSLLAHSAEEEIARDLLCFERPDAVIAVCDATCLSRNLNLVLQIMEICPHVILCVNLMDEAGNRNIRIHLDQISERLGIPAVGICARHRQDLKKLMRTVEQSMRDESETKIAHAGQPTCLSDIFPEPLEEAVAELASAINAQTQKALPARWLAQRMLEGDTHALRSAERIFDLSLCENAALCMIRDAEWEKLRKAGYTSQNVSDTIASAIVRRAETVCEGAIQIPQKSYQKTDGRIDRILTGRLSAYPAMLLLLAVIFWLTMTGANYPSQLLQAVLFGLETKLLAAADAICMPPWLSGALINGAYRVLAWVVSVMLPPMAIFFPLFTLLEDFGYLPRIAYNLDRPFQRCCACGKQALTMCMGFGCNAAGVTGCRIIDSPRERMLAILTNSMVPCNGRFPALFAVLTIFFAGGTAASGTANLIPALLLTLLIVFSVLVTLGVTKLLSHTLLRGMPSSFTMELPPYRMPQIGSVIVRSVLDRTVFVLARAAAVAAPAGLLIYTLANVSCGEVSTLRHFVNFLEPVGAFLGLDGAILTAFLLGLPANEIVIPITVMIYLSQGTLSDMQSLEAMRELFTANGWDGVTAVCFLIFSLLHWPCSTTLLTIHKETGSWKWTAAAFLIPTACGMFLCAAISHSVRIFEFFL